MSKNIQVAINIILCFALYIWVVVTGDNEVHYPNK